jgi:hypothetical protein
MIFFNNRKEPEPHFVISALALRGNFFKFRLLGSGFPTLLLIGWQIWKDSVPGSGYGSGQGSSVFI